MKAMRDPNRPMPPLIADVQSNVRCGDIWGRAMRKGVGLLCAVPDDRQQGTWAKVALAWA
eukprot:4291196-Amphidinium_carterae.1